MKNFNMSLGFLGFIYSLLTGVPSILAAPPSWGEEIHMQLSGADPAGAEGVYVWTWSEATIRYNLTGVPDGVTVGIGTEPIQTWGGAWVDGAGWHTHLDVHHSGGSFDDDLIGGTYFDSQTSPIMVGSNGTWAAVPEPGAMLGAACVLCMLMCRRR